jgi:hypothetical protein
MLRSVPRPLLRSEPRTVTDSELPALLRKWNFFEREKHWTGEFPNDFVDQNLTVFDRTTGLSWTKAADSDFEDVIGVRLRVRERNRQRYAGCDDWRLPTLEEAASLLACARRKDRFHLHPLFPALPSRHFGTGAAILLLTADYRYYSPDYLRYTTFWGINFWSAQIGAYCPGDFDRSSLRDLIHIRLCRPQPVPSGPPRQPAGAPLPPPAAPRRKAKLPLPPVAPLQQLLRSRERKLPLLNGQPYDAVPFDDIDALLRGDPDAPDAEDEPPEIIILGDA